MPGNPSNKRVGADGEGLVCAYLEGLGWRVLAQNYRCAAGEADIVAEEPGASGLTLVFVEVKARRGRAHGTPFEAVNLRKQARLFAVAEAYLAERGAGGDEPGMRFDVAEVRFSPDGNASIILHRAALHG